MPKSPLTSYTAGHLPGPVVSPGGPSILPTSQHYAVKGKEEGSVRLIKGCILFVLCFQNSGHALLTRYSTSILHESYSSSEVVIVGEFIKLFFSGTLAVLEMSEPMTARLFKLQALVMHSHKVLVLAALYMVGNILAYYALARVEASTYTVFLQLKVLTTAAFSRVLLGKRFSWTQWRALILLIVGCILVASPTIDPYPDRTSAANPSDADGSLAGPYMGIGAVLVMVSISGFSSVYFEGILKDEREKCTIWERNFQLSFFSIILLALYGLYERHLDATTNSVVRGPFSGWTTNTVLICVIQASGGLLVAATLKYADSVIKTLVTAGSIVLSTVFGYLLLEGVLNMYVGLGCMVTIIAIFNYMFMDFAP